MMQPATETADVVLSIYSQRDVGRWAFELKGPHFISRFGAGFKFSATRHSLLSIAFVSGLKQLSRYHVSRYLTERGEMQDAFCAIPRKLKIRVECSRPDFIDALTHIGHAGPRRARMAGQLFKAVRKELNRFDCTFEAVEPAQQMRLKRWANRIVTMPTARDGFPMPEHVASNT